MDNKKDLNSITLIDDVRIDLIQHTLTKISQFQDLIRNTLKEKQDFGIIPGTNKPTLLKPGAEKTLMILGLTSKYEILETIERTDEGYISYTVKCILSKEDKIITEGLGSANSWENKYKNQNPYAVQNTLLKMAKKRAQIDATLTVASLSEIFTQDLEDMDLTDINGDPVQNKNNYNNNYNQGSSQQQRGKQVNYGSSGPGYNNQPQQQQQYNQQPQQWQQQQQFNQQPQQQPRGQNGQVVKPISLKQVKRLRARANYDDQLIHEIITRYPYNYTCVEEILNCDYDDIVSRAETAATVRIRNS